MEKISDKLTIEGTNSFYTNFKTLAPSIYTNLFGDTEPKVLDLSLLSNCGERYASPLLTTYPLEEVVTLIVAEKSNSWERIKKAMFSEYDLTTLGENTTEVTNQRNSNTSNNSNNTNKEKLYSFDSTTPSDSVENSNIGETTGNITETGTTTTKVSGSKYDIQLSIDREIRLRRLSFINMVVKDTMNYLALAIY